MTDILDEVLSDKNDERKMIYFKKALPIIGVVTILIVLSMIISDWRGSRAQKHNTEIGDTLIKSLENLNTEPQLAVEGLDYVIKNAENNAKDLAALQLIAINISSNNIDSAMARIEDIADGKGYAPLTVAYAKLMWLSIMVESKDLSDDDSDKMNKYFDSFKEDTPFYGSVSLLNAIFYSKKAPEKSAAILENLISNKNLATTVKEEAKALLSNLKIKN